MTFEFHPFIFRTHLDKDMLAKRFIEMSTLRIVFPLKMSEYNTKHIVWSIFSIVYCWIPKKGFVFWGDILGFDFEYVSKLYKENNK